MSLGNLLYTSYRTPLGPGAEPVLADLMNDWISFQLDSSVLNSVCWLWWDGKVGYSPSSESFAVSLWILQRLLSISSLGHMSWPLHFWSSSYLVNPKGFARKAGCFLSLSLVHFLEIFCYLPLCSPEGYELPQDSPFYFSSLAPLNCIFKRWRLYLSFVIFSAT